MELNNALFDFLNLEYPHPMHKTCIKQEYISIILHNYFAKRKFNVNVQIYILAY